MTHRRASLADILAALTALLIGLWIVGALR